MKRKSTWVEWVAVIVGVLFAIRGSEAVLRLSKAGERVKEAKKELSVAKERNEELRLRLDEVDSPDFVEKEAREKLGYGREGEIILVLPEQKEQEGGRAGEQEKKPNWKKWWDLYIRI